MKPIFAVLLLVVCVACEKKPTEEELRAQEEEAAATKRAVAATPVSTPKPGSWMWQNRENPLEKKPVKN